MKEINIVHIETLADNKYKLQNVRFEKKDNDGKIKMVNREIYNRPDAVSVLLVDYSQNILLLTKQFRLPVYLHADNGGYLLEACAGVIDEGETAEETAAREVKEETGYEIKNLKKIAATYTSPASLMEYVHLFIAEININNKAYSGGGLKEEGEEIENVVLNFAESKQMLDRSEIHDMKTIALLQYFFLNK